MILAVSDVHLGYEMCDKGAFTEFVHNYVSETLGPDDHLVLLGDIFDFWRKRNADCLMRSEVILKDMLSLDTTVHYVVGNHDYAMLQFKRMFREYGAFEMEKYVRLQSGSTSFFFVHGYQLDVVVNYESMTLRDYERISEELCRSGNALGRVLSGLWGITKKLQKPPEKRKNWVRHQGSIPKTVAHIKNVEDLACSAGRSVVLGMRSDEMLVFGHTHRPFVNERTANTGSWLRDASPEYERNTYITVDAGAMTLHTWQQGRGKELAQCESA